jgi:hypothetical protein
MPAPTVPVVDWLNARATSGVENRSYVAAVIEDQADDLRHTVLSAVRLVVLQASINAQCASALSSVSARFGLMRHG